MRSEYQLYARYIFCVAAYERDMRSECRLNFFYRLQKDHKSAKGSSKQAILATTIVKQKNLHEGYRGPKKFDIERNRFIH